MELCRFPFVQDESCNREAGHCGEHAHLNSAQLDSKKWAIHERERVDLRTSQPPSPENIRAMSNTGGGITTFELHRRNDESGVSGTGLVLQGAIFKDGTVSVHWCTSNADTSTTNYGIENGKSGWERFLDIHVGSHPTNDVEIRFWSPSPLSPQLVWNQKSDPDAVIEGMADRLVTALTKLRDLVPPEDRILLDNDAIDEVLHGLAPLQSEKSFDPNDIEQAAKLVLRKYLEFEDRRRKRY